MKHIYKSVNNLYENKFLTIRDACKKINISPSVYYNACKELNRKSVNYDKSKDAEVVEEKLVKNNVRKVYKWSR